MSAYEPNSRHLREVLIFCFNIKKSADEAHRMLSNTYGEDAISERTVKNGDFDVKDQHGIWWDQLGVVYYELLKPTETITVSCACARRLLLAACHNGHSDCTLSAAVRIPFFLSMDTRGESETYKKDGTDKDYTTNTQRFNIS
ncbi:uncharacterized protein TNCV_4187241 [Trichonephila clavipes]|nr:uncharacterized protein TNCV_4187241 [Trichonephila clavipes]